MNEVDFTVNLDPISSNKIWRGRRMKTDDYKDWRRSAFFIIKNLLLPKVDGWVGIESNFYIRNFKGADVPNFLKATFDALVEAEVIEDDRFIKWERSEKWPIKKGDEEYFTIKIIPLKFN